MFHAFNSSHPSVFCYVKYRTTSQRYRETSRNTPANDADNQVRFNKLTLNTMPSAIPSSPYYYQDKGRNHGKGWEYSKSQASMSSPEKVHVVETGRELEAGSKLEIVADGEVHAIEENMI